MAEELTFHLEDFDGPLELLLALVAKHKMDLHNIPILELIDQYTATVEQADPDPETASAFIEMAAHLVEMKSFLLLPRSEEGERMKQEFTGQLIEYDQCRRMAALLRAKGERPRCSCGRRWRWSGTTPTTLHHAPQMLADYWNALAGRTKPAPEPTQQQFEPLGDSAHGVGDQPGGVYPAAPHWRYSGKNEPAVAASRPAAPTWPPFWPCWNWCAAAASSWTSGRADHAAGPHQRDKEKE